jgi:predicted lipid-binding transport protein (Tim44 family)/uncharacterized membrane protein YgcG
MSLRFILLNGLFGWLLLMGGALPALARGGGGCFLPDTPVLKADGTSVFISEVRPGEALKAFTPEGEVVSTTVRRILTHEVDVYWVLTTDRIMLRVTSEHPFFIGNGEFRTLEALKIGDVIFGFDGQGLSSQTIRSRDRIEARTLVYNLQTDAPNTFFANGIAVHNKGGGCFTPGTKVKTASGEIPIENLKPGDKVVGISDGNQPLEATVEACLAQRARVLSLDTDHGVLHTTSDHPLRLPRGGFREAGQLTVGDDLVFMAQNGAQPARIRSIALAPEETTVFNLSVTWPHTFIADGFWVHNKGGGGGGGFHGSSGGCRSSSGSQSGGSSGDPTWVLFVVILIFIIIVIAAKTQSKKNEDLDYVYSGSEITRKSSKTLQLLQFIAKVDPPYTPEALTVAAKSTFLQLQRCWQERRYEPMKALLLPDLYAAHCGQINGLVRNHEINLIEGVAIEAIDLVNVRYPHAENAREFTALITARARDYYLDDRTQAFLRGDEEPARFQEFWTFQRQNGQWLLREIEQTRESEKLKEENFFETFTHDGLQKVYDQTANEGGPIGPWLEKETATKATRIERLLNFLVLTDKIWNRQAMIERARQTFLQVMLAWESGDPGKLPIDFLFPEIAESHRQGIATLHADGQSVAYRNLCVRKVELVLVRNFKDNNQDEFTARISAHAQYICRKGNQILRQDEEVAPFEEFWTFGRRDGQWKLKEIVPSIQGESLVKQENIDEESSAEQLRWFYGKTRAS